jgi:hypothetical protein
MIAPMSMGRPSRPHARVHVNRRFRTCAKVVVYELLSLDGEPEGFIVDWDDAMEAHLVTS